MLQKPLMETHTEISSALLSSPLSCMAQSHKENTELTSLQSAKHKDWTRAAEICMQLSVKARGRKYT